ncbi:hypothetical protein GH714_035565 [Hevea brasiliensis]|uniref:Uncharacterized protein n=1 Tax=Hevea brasiliensis TaxID=3981 RepID=A0A6A6NEF2_HEVBR|nr:hypothetical protein GH714_035565 [Hevea brasiliensis]
MESHMEMVEKNLAILEDDVSKLCIDHGQIHSELSGIENILATIARGRTTFEEGEISNPLTLGYEPTAKGSAQCPPPIIWKPNESAIFPKQLELPMFEDEDPLGWLTYADAPNKSFRTLIAAEDEEDMGHVEIITAEIQHSRLEILEVIKAHFARMDLPFFSASGISHPKTMKLQGGLGENEWKSLSLGDKLP